MTRYIDEEPLLAEQYEGFDRANETDWQKGYWAGIDEMCEKIKAQQTADVVEVVRCHNCEYHGIRDKCPLLNMSPYRDDDRGYCSEGKRLEWMEVIKELEHKGFVIKQFDDNHAELYDEDKMVARFSCIKKQSEEELRSLVDYYIELREKRG